MLYPKMPLSVMKKVGIGKWNIPENRDSDMYFVNFLPEYL
jgi:hypothetical protein